MFGAIFSPPGAPESAILLPAQLLATALLTGVAIKLMDDHLDRNEDRISGTATSQDVLGRGTVPYAMVALIVATGVRHDATIALFFGAYAVGMVHEWGDRMPTKVPAWVESGVAFVVAIGGSGLAMAGGALCLMLFVQCVDDILDDSTDRRSGARNLVRMFGSVETHFLAGAALLFAIGLAPVLSVAVFVAMALIDELFRRLFARIGRGA